MGRSDRDRYRPGGHDLDREPPPAELWITASPGTAAGGGHGGRRGGAGGSGRNRWIALVAGFALLVAVIAVQHVAGGQQAVTPTPTRASDARPTSGTAPATSTTDAPNSTPATTASSFAWEGPGQSAGGPAPGGTTEGPDGATSTAPVTSTAPKLPSAGSWELVGYGPDGVIRYLPATGRVVVTPMTDLTGNSPLAFTVTAGAAFVGSMNAATTFVVPDGKPATALTWLPEPVQAMLPGPDPDHAWAVVPGSEPGSLILLDSRGRPTGTTMDTPAAIGGAGYPVTPDGAGYALVSGVGGTYDLRPDGATLVTHGRVLAVGPTALLVYECDDAARCRSVLIDRRTGARRAEPALDQPSAETTFPVQGVISPDGASAALLGIGGVVLVDLGTGTRRGSFNLGDYAVGADASTMFAFSPDSRYLLIVRQAGGLLAVDTTTGRELPPLAIPPMVAIAVRPAH